MAYEVYETREAIEDVSRIAEYMAERLKNPKAAMDFIECYDTEIKKLAFYPHAYKNTRLQYLDYEIRMKAFGTYHVFYIIKAEEKIVIVLRILKNRQNWNHILRIHNKYHW